ncbi:T-complex protein 1 subunit alpha-like [Phragmites australis]|uniref:T-complex protein 1 subunit alpha-like n=1 Tax=Phragmites australis TaxID=29695 RepID=UPI002D786C58|nr:T-complex protein 1 subunit alpha-like [Phragmites australis]
MNIRNWDKIAEDNKHLMDWYNYRGQKGMGKPYDPKKPAHFLSLLRNVDSHKYAKDFFVDGFIDRLLFACYPVQLSEMQEALWKYDRLGHLYIEENFNDGCAHITDAMPRCAPQTAQEPVASSSDDVIVYPKKKGETILKKSEVEHPAAKVLVELVELEDREVRDGPTSVVFIAAELIKRGNDRMTNKIHLTNTISGYRLAMHEACKYVEEKLAIEVDKLGKESLINCAKISMSSKLINSDSDFVVKLAVESVQAVKTTNGKGELKYPIESVNISKTRGKCRSAQVMLTRVTSARIACLDFNLEKTQKQVGVQVPVSDPRAQRESDTRKETIEKILKAGANVVLTTKGINNMSLKYFVQAGAIAVRHVRKEDLHRVAEATGATMVTTFVDKEGEETFDSSFLGYADEVVEERIADDAVILVKAQKIAYSLKMNPS